MHSNYTLKFPRSSREAFGYQVQRSEFEGESGDRFVGVICAMAIAFIVGLVVGGL